MSLYDDNFDRELDEILERARLKEMEVIKKIFNKIGIHNTNIGYYFNYADKKLVLYTERPGLIIGPHGCNIELINHLINDELCVHDFSIEFVEVKGKIISV